MVATRGAFSTAVLDSSVRIQNSDDSLMLRVAVQLPATIANDAESLLDAFDEQWWLENCRRSNGALVFDYEIQDAV